jgi:hypothetical protein
MSHRGFRTARILGDWFCTTCICVQLQAQRYGKERWAVKTGTDSGAGAVDLASPQNTTIAQLIGLTPPNPVPADNRFGPTEDTVFVVNATLADYKLEGGSKGDSDCHLVLQHDQGKTMVAKIPSPSCLGDGSPFAAQIASARAAFDAQFTATTSFQTANVPVQVTGVGFFDFVHGQHGAAPNVIELHPVLNIVFNPSQNRFDFTLSMAPPTINMIPGGSSSTIISTSTTGTAADAPALTVSSTPTCITTQNSPAGPGKATASLTATQVEATGSFPLTITGTANGNRHSLTTLLNLSSFSPAPGAQQWEYKVSVVKIQGSVDAWNNF